MKNVLKSWCKNPFETKEKRAFVPLYGIWNGYGFMLDGNKRLTFISFETAKKHLQSLNDSYLTIKRIA